MKRFAFLLVLLLGGCVGVPEGLSPVRGFELQRYLGTWYEIARLDHPFERGMSNITATYRLREDGGVEVINRGYLDAEQRWKEAVGKAYFVEDPAVARLKVSFFGPFYGAYNVIALDRANYGHALVAGPDRSYLWILARTPQLDDATLAGLVALARDSGFATDQLIFVRHDRTPPEKGSVTNAPHSR